MLFRLKCVGFDKYCLRKACCGIGGEYNYDKSRICGNPTTYINWDGVHLTQTTYKLLAIWLNR